MAPKIVKLHTASNEFQRAEVVQRNRNKRIKYRQFFVEGVKCLNAAREAHWPLDALYYSFERPLSDWGREFVKTCGAPVCYELPFELLAKLSEKEDVSELVALARMPEDSFERISLDAGPLLVLLDRPASPGNLGTSIRSCEAFGVDAVIISGHAADVYHPQAVRGSMGALFHVPVVRVPSHEEVFVWIEKVRDRIPGIQVFGTSASAEANLFQSEISGPALIIFGNETRGLSRAYQERCDQIIQIPISGAASSLNVSCALSIVLAERSRQRGSVAA